MLLSMLISPCVYAQKVTSESSSITIIRQDKPKSKLDITSYWLLKAGGGVELSYALDGPQCTYNISVGYHHLLDKSGLYIGGQAGSTKVPWEKFDLYSNIYLGPVVGLKKAIGSKSILDCHVGADYSLQFEKGGKSDLMLEAGIGIWFNRFLVELQYGALNCVEECFGNQICINLGIKF